MDKFLRRGGKAMTADLSKISWPRTRLGEAVVALGSKFSGCSSETEAISLPPFVLEQGDSALDHWMDAASRSAGMTAEPVNISHGEAVSFLRSCAPALVRINFPGRPMFLAVIGGGRNTVRVLSSD